MSEHGVPEDPGRPPDPPITARQAKARHRSRTRPPAGLVYLQEITRAEQDWMRRMSISVARSYQVDPDDLLQELRIGLLECDVIDRGRAEVHGWLRTRAKWRAQDLRRRDQHQRLTGTVSLDDDTFDEPPALPFAGRPDPDWSVERLAKMGLSRDEGQLTLLLCWGLNISMQDFAEFTETSYPAVRQRQSRAARKIRSCFDLDPDETAAYVAWRACGSHAAAATNLGTTERQLRGLVRAAERKIRTALGDDLPDDVTTRDEDDPDAHR